MDKRGEIMDDELKIVIKAVLDDNAEKDLNSQLKNLNLEPISPKLKLDLDTSKSKKSAEKAIRDINKTISKNIRPVIKNIKSDLANASDPYWRSIIEKVPFNINEKPKKSIKLPFQIDLNNPDEVQMEMERIVSEFTRNKGKLIDYKVSTTSGFDEKTNDKVERLSAAVIKYKNELGETITKQLQWQKLGEKIDENGEKKAIMGFAENYAIYSQNIEKATEKQEKLRISAE